MFKNALPYVLTLVTCSALAQSCTEDGPTYGDYRATHPNANWRHYVQETVTAQGKTDMAALCKVKNKTAEDRASAAIVNDQTQRAADAVKEIALNSVLDTDSLSLNIATYYRQAARAVSDSALTIDQDFSENLGANAKSLRDATVKHNLASVLKVFTHATHGVHVLLGIERREQSSNATRQLAPATLTRRKP